MSLLSGISFASPWILLGLIVLPAIWFLLRVTPPSPRKVVFPPLRLLLGLNATEEAPARTPWWLLLLRLIAAALIIAALAQPMIGEPPKPIGNGPLVLFVDNGWTAAHAWKDREAAISDALNASSRQGRPVAIVGTANAPAPVSLLDAGDAQRSAEELEPQSWLPDRNRARAELGRAHFSSTPEIVWFSDGLDYGNDAQPTAAALAKIGYLKILSDASGHLQLALKPESNRTDGFGVTVIRAECRNLSVPRAFGLGANDRDAKTIRAVAFRLQRQLQMAGRIGKDFQIPNLGECRCGRLRVIAIIESIAKPDNLRRGRKMRSPELRARAIAIRQPALRLKFFRTALRVSGIKQADRRGRVRRAHDGDGAALARGSIERVADRGLAVFPRMRRRPAIVDEENQRPVADWFGRFADHWLRQRRNDERGGDQAQQQQPPGRACGRFLRRVQSEEQPQRLEHNLARARRRHAQQKPDRGQHDQPEKNPRRRETDTAQQAHASRNPHLSFRAAEIGEQRGKRRLRPLVGAMDEIAPAQTPRKIAQGFGMGAKARAVGALHAFGAAENIAEAPGGRFKPRAAVKRKFFFGRIDDVNQMASDAAARQAAQCDFDLAQRRKKIAEPDELRIFGDRRIGRQRVIAGRHLRHLVADARERDAARRRRTAIAIERNAFATANEQRAQRQRQHARAVDLGHIREFGFESHPGRSVAPQRHRFRRFPFAFAHEKMRRLRGLPPVDGRRGVFRLKAAKLPEGLAHAGFAPTMNTEIDKRGEAFRGHKQGRQAGRKRLGLIAQARRAVCQRMLRHSRSITSLIVVPSARAEKLSAMRWRRTGWASAITSSTDGAKRPSISALARTASIKAWLARGPGPHEMNPRMSLAPPSSGRAARTSFKIASTTFSPTGKRRTMACASISTCAVQIAFTGSSSPKVVASIIRFSDSGSG